MSAQVSNIKEEQEPTRNQMEGIPGPSIASMNTLRGETDANSQKTPEPQKERLNLEIIIVSFRRRPKKVPDITKDRGVVSGASSGARVLTREDSGGGKQNPIRGSVKIAVSSKKMPRRYLFRKCRKPERIPHDPSSGSNDIYFQIKISIRFTIYPRIFRSGGNCEMIGIVAIGIRTIIKIVKME